MIMRNQKAFTLIELMVTLAVISIVGFMAVPAFNQMIVNNRTSALAGDFMDALKFARTASMTSGGYTVLCPQDNTGTACGSDWNNGWLVAKDSATSETASPSILNEEAILRRWNAPDHNAVMTFSENRTYIRFKRLGVLGRDQGAAPAVVGVKITGCTGDSARTLTVNTMGLVTVLDTSC